MLWGIAITIIVFVIALIVFFIGSVPGKQLDSIHLSLGVSTDGKVFVQHEEYVFYSVINNGLITWSNGARVQLKLADSMLDLSMESDDGYLLMEIAVSEDSEGVYRVQGDYVARVACELRLLGTGETSDEDTVLRLELGEGKISHEGELLFTFSDD